LEGMGGAWAAMGGVGAGRAAAEEAKLVEREAATKVAKEKAAAEW